MGKLFFSIVAFLFFDMVMADNSVSSEKYKEMQKVSVQILQARAAESAKLEEQYNLFKRAINDLNTITARLDQKEHISANDKQVLRHSLEKIEVLLSQVKNRYIDGWQQHSKESDAIGIRHPELIIRKAKKMLNTQEEGGVDFIFVPPVLNESELPRSVQVVAPQPTITHIR